MPHAPRQARFGRSILFVVLLGVPSTAAAAKDWPKAVEAALAKARSNRPELEKVLRHYRRGSDKQKFEAACFLIRNMPGHAYVESGLFDAKQKEIAFDVLRYKSLGEAQNALRELEKKHGPLHFGPRKIHRDVETVSADYLIENIDLAFKAWREKPWARDMTFESFCEYILPYRANKEPVERWRAACEIPTATISRAMKNPRDPQEAAGLVQKHNPHPVAFHDLYYLHPTDQGFKELCGKPVGRCGDMSNMQVYVYRANGIAVAGDYTPYWANRDNNHGWEVVLDKHGRGRAGLFNKAAKVYRKMFSHNPANLRFQVKKGEAMPPWLSLPSYRDVTDQYLETTDVTVTLVPSAKPGRFAYLCVFNGGEWRPIHWGRVEGPQVRFTKMGRGIAYLPAYYDGKVVPAAPPFLLDDKGTITQLVADVRKVERVKLTRVKPKIKDDDLKKELPAKRVEAGKKYSLYVWDHGWRRLAEQTAGFKDPAVFKQLPPGGLYWITCDDDREVARIFTVEGGKQRFW